MLFVDPLQAGRYTDTKRSGSAPLILNALNIRPLPSGSCVIYNVTIDLFHPDNCSISLYTLPIAYSVILKFRKILVRCKLYKRYILLILFMDLWCGFHYLCESFLLKFEWEKLRNLNFCKTNTESLIFMRSCCL